MEKIVLGLGSNKPFTDSTGSILEPVTVLSQAVKQLSSYVSDINCSHVWRTAPMYFTKQESFYNMALTGMYDGEPDDLLDIIHKIEASLGRDRSREIRNGPRSIDIDIELFGSRIIKTPALTVPHPRIQERAFILVPMLEILPECAEPLNGTLYAQYLKYLSTDDILLYGDLPR